MRLCHRIAAWAVATSFAIVAQAQEALQAGVVHVTPVTAAQGIAVRVYNSSKLPARVEHLKVTIPAAAANAQPCSTTLPAVALEAGEVRTLPAFAATGLAGCVAGRTVPGPIRHPQPRIGPRVVEETMAPNAAARNATFHLSIEARVSVEDRPTETSSRWEMSVR
jgi:hypothetical protein